MKKFLLILLALALLIPASGFAVDLSGMSFDELVALKDQINLAIWQSEEWQEVTVPQGVWIVGQDIPAGKWTVRCSDENIDMYLMSQTEISWGSSYDKKELRIRLSDRYGEAEVYNKNSEHYSGGITEITIEVDDGDVIIIDDLYNKAVFSPYSGKPDLGFK